MIKLGKTAKRKIVDYHLSRYACYLIVQNSNPSKEVVALGQTYFAIQTRKQEISEKEYTELSENEKRFYNRNITKKGSYQLNQVAQKAGLKNFGEFHNAGYKGLYNGETADDIAKRKKLRYREDILDNMRAMNWRLIFFKFLKRNKKYKTKIYKVKPMQKMPITKLEKTLENLLLKMEERCLKKFQCLKRA